MTVLRDQNREEAEQGQAPSSFSRRVQDLKGKMQQHTASLNAALDRVGKKRIMLAGGALTLLAVAGFGGQAYIQANTVDYYEVYRNGVMVGTVDAPETVEAMLTAKKAELAEANPGLEMELEAGEIAYTAERAYKAKPDSEETIGKLAGMLTSHAVGVEVRVNGKLIGIAKDQETADNVLQRVQANYAPAAKAASKLEVTALAFTADAAKTAAADTAVPKSNVKSVSFVEKVDTPVVDVDPNRIQDADTLYERLVTGNAKATKYVVQEGDCIGCIAQKFGISPQLIYQNNPQIEGEMIRVGDELDLTVLQPQLTVQTVENVTETEEIEPDVIVQKNDEMRAGQQKTLRKGEPGQRLVTYQLVKQNGFLMSEEVLDEEIIKPAIAAIVVKGTKVVLGEGSGKFAWPVSGARLTSSYGQRWGRLHKGIDMIGNKNILAADHGVVTFTGTKNGMGKTVIIDHKNGFETVYGHLSKITIKKGAVVEKGDKLGIMGNTGNSTGTHLHFEIHKNGKVQNPKKYL